MKLIYVAGPITKGSQWQNGAQADDAMLELMKAGVGVINPMLTMWSGACRKMVNTYPASTGVNCLEMPTRPEAKAHGGFQKISHKHWLDMDKEIISRVDAVLRLPGQSSGADEEVAFANEKGIPVFTDIAECIRWATT